jgi:hypothetical protein
MPSESGVTSSRRRSLVAAFAVPERICAWTAAPRATTSSGLSSVWSLRPRASSGAADHDDLVDLRRSETSVLEGLLDGCGGALDDGSGELLVLRAGDLAEIVLGWLSLDSGECELEARAVRGGECDLGCDDRLAEGLDGFGVFGDVDTEVTANVVERDGEQEVVDVVAAEVGVAAGGDDLEDAVVELEDGDIEGAAAEVVDGDDAVDAVGALGSLLVEAVGEGGGGGLAQNFEAGDAAGVLGGLTLRVVEVGGDGDDGLGYFRAEEAFGVLLELQENVGGDFGRCEGEAADVELEDFAGLKIRRQMKGEVLELGLDVGEVAAHEALDGVDGVGGVGEQHAARGVSDREAIRRVLIEGDDRGDDGRAVFAGDDDRGVALHECNERVGGAEIDPHNGGDGAVLCWMLFWHCFLCFRGRVRYRIKRTRQGLLSYIRRNLSEIWAEIDRWV